MQWLPCMAHGPARLHNLQACKANPRMCLSKRKDRVCEHRVLWIVLGSVLSEHRKLTSAHVALSINGMPLCTPTRLWQHTPPAMVHAPCLLPAHMSQLMDDCLYTQPYFIGVRSISLMCSLQPKAACCGGGPGCCCNDASMRRVRWAPGPMGTVHRLITRPSQRSCSPNL